MGVPKFYRWISERYPCLSEVVREYQIPDFDNLYLDMNGIIHGCSHPNDDDPHFRITEEKIFADICHYIECLFKMIRPKKVFFMAVDGVAPRAKMNQQRGRRFRSAREAEECEKRAVSKGEVLPTEERFDSNCITPGTEFMVKLQEHLKYFVTDKISTDKTWQGIRVYLSGHETPGEGEHKIMEFIRSEKSKPDFNPHTRHCLYGLDADLIMLGLCSHEPHFSLLREEINFARKKNVQRIQTPEEITFHLLHLSLLREYIDYEFSSLKDKLPFPYDIENIIDDWVLMGFLVGNDFIPHLPHMHIAHDALPSLYQVYIQVLPTLDGYINEGGYLNLLRFEKYLQGVSRNDYEQFEETFANLKWFKSKTGRSRIGHANPPSAKKPKTLTEDSDCKADNLQCDLNVSFSVDENDSRNATDLIGWEENTGEDSLSDVDDEVQPDDPDLMEDEFTQHKRDYYIKKLAYEHVTPEVLREQAECYVSAIQWILHYYYNGVCSWSWYYPHHYAPYVSDVKDFHDMKLEFEIGTPFLPFEQLLAVLPAASKKFLPKPYQSLMCDANSPLIDYYPTEFETDLNGKQHSWEAIVLIPFIDEKRLLDAMKPIFEMVSKPEQDRNVHKPCLLYTYCVENLGKFSASALGNFPDVDFNHAKCEQLSLDSFYVERSMLRKGLCEGFKRDMYIPGFPTLKHIPHKVCLKKAGVKVFQMPSRNNSMILDVEPPQTMFTDQEVCTIAQELIGNTVYVGWPHIMEARVVSISTPQMRFRRSESSSSRQSDVVSETQSEDDLREWHCYNNVVTDKYKDRWGVIIGRTQILVEAQIQMGKKYVHVQGDHIALEKQWSVTTNMYAYQTVIKSLDVFSTKQDPPKTLEDLYPAKSMCFLLSSQYYGRCAEVISCDSTGPRASIQLAVDLSEDPNLTPAITAHNTVISRYFTTYAAAQRLGVSGHLLSRMMGTFQVTRSGSKSDKKVNIGLNLKFNTRSKEVVGFSRRIGKDWTFSAEAMEAMEQYLNKFPEMFENINMNLSNRPSIPEDDIFPEEEDAAKLGEVLEFLKTLPCYTGQQQACGSVILEADIVKVVEDEVDKAKGAGKKTAILNFSPRHIFSPSDCRGISLPDPTVTFELFDRVINIKESSTVPLGHKGTVIGIYPAEKMEDMTYDVVFDNVFPGGLAIRCSPNRGYRVSPYSVINITHGLRKENYDSGAGGQKPTAIVRPQTSQHHPAGVSSVYGKSVRSNANNKGPKFQYGRGRACPSGPSQAPTIMPRIGTSGATTIINPLALHTAICPAPPNLAQEYHFRKFNHSPNSPFVPRQACPPAATGPQPQFITPKVFTNTQFQLQYRQPPPLITVRQGAQSQESEFANLWMQLQMANTNPGTVRNRDDVKPPDKPLNVLINSAKSRPRNSPRVAAMLGMNPAVPCNSAPCPGGSRQNSEFEKVLHALQNITVQQQPLNKGQGDSAAVSHQQISSAATAPKPASVQELGSMSSSSSPAITKLVRPNDLAKEGKDAKKEENVSVKAQQSYGRSISVEELFRDAKETERQRQVQAQAQMQVALGPTTSLDNSSCVSVLEHFVYSYSRELPNYDCIMVGPSKMHVGRVILPDKRAYTGRPEASKKAAEESAAFVALKALGQPAPKLFPSNLRGLGPYSDNMLASGVIPPGPPAYQRIPSASASFQGIRFPSSVGSRANMRSNMPQHPFPHRQPGPGMQQVPMPYSNVNANMQGPYGNRNQGFHKPYQQDASRLGYGEQSGPRGRHQYQNQNQSFGSPNVSPQKPNAFVPLQVSRQQKSSSGKKATSYKEPICEMRNDVHEAVVHVSTANVQKETTNIPGNIHGNVLSGESQGRAKRRSSRLAVNFNKGE